MVPKGWEVKQLANLTTKISDGIHSTPTYVEKSDIYFINGNNLKNGSIVVSDGTKKVCPENAQNHRRDLSNRTILMSINGTIGNLAFYNNENVVLGKSACYINVTNNVDIKYIYYTLNSSKTQNFYTTELTGSTIKNLSLKTIKSTKILTPPLPEQQKIAKILSTWDKAIRTTERLIDNSTQQKKALMQQLLTGKKRLLDESGQQFEGEWDWVNLENVCDVKGGKRLPKGNAVSESITPYPYIRVADMYMGGVDLSDIKYVPDSIAPLIKNYTISKDDLFITVAGTLGIVGQIPNELDGANLTENADKLTNIKCEKTFLLYVMMSSIIQRYIEAESTQNAQPKLALARIRGFKVPFPLLKEQQKIATVLTNADKEIELLEQQLADLQQEKKALMQVLLTGKKRVVVDG